MFRKQPLIFYRNLFDFNKSNYSIFILFIIFLATSCEFQPSEIPETFVERPDENAPLLEVYLTPEMDTLTLFESALIHYNFKVASKEVHWVQFYFDEELVHEKEFDLNKILEMQLNISNYNDGLHYLKILVFISSNSGSIADKVGAEGYLYEFQWPVKIDRTQRRTVKIVDIKPYREGTLIKWEKFPFANFQQYTLSKTSFFENVTTEFDITNQNENYYIDTECLEGENLYYAVRVNGVGETGIYYSEKLPTPKVTLNEFLDGELTWKPTRNPARLGYYRVFEGENSVNNERKVLFGEGTSLSCGKMSFGGSIRYNIQFVPKTVNTNVALSALEKATVEFALGDEIPKFEKTKQINGTNHSIYTIGDKLVVFDHLTRTKVDSLVFTENLRMYRLSPDGKVVYTLSGNTLEAWQINNLKSLGKITLEQIITNMPGIYEVTVSNTSKVLFALSNKKLLLYDFSKFEIVFEMENSSEYGTNYISPDGNRMLLYESSGLGNRRIRYFNLESDVPQEIYDSADLYTDKLIYHFFSSAENGQIILRVDDEIQVRDVASFQLIKTIPIEMSDFIIYDPEYNNFIYEKATWPKTGECYLINITNEQVLDTLYLNSGNVVLHRNFLIGRNGRQLILNKL